MPPSAKLKLGDLLIQQGLLTSEQLKLLLTKQKETGKRLGKLIVEEEILSQDIILSFLSQQTGIPFAPLKDLLIDPEVIKKVPSKVCRKHLLIPIAYQDGMTTVAISDPMDLRALDDVELLMNTPIEPVLCSEDEIQAAIDEHYGDEGDIDLLLDDMSEDDMELMQDGGVPTAESAEAEDETGVIKLVNLLILEAVKNKASDIHIEPFENVFIVRQRIDGVLHKLPSPRKNLQSGIISRIKVMAEMNIAETRLPQDGRIRLRLSGKEIDIRVSTLPTLFGESVVMRILDRSGIVLDLDQIGMAPDLRQRFSTSLENPNGIVLVTGPTGSGKTTTLYAGVRHINNTEVKFITVEDPVEYEVGGLVQCQVREKVGMTFPAALRSILRQDPDIILIGELRDMETAGIAIESSLTGHMVLATLHTNTAAGTITRLIDMGIEPFLLTSTLVGVIGQRLIRKICNYCKESYEPDPYQLNQLGVTDEESRVIQFFQGSGCSECTNTGYSGRTGIYELFPMNEELEDLILKKSPEGVLHQAAVQTGMRTMAQDGLLKIKEGITTVEEVLRVAPLRVG